MKKNKRNFIIMSALTFVTLSCTKNFDAYNRNPYGVTEEEMSRIPKGGTQLIALQKLVVPEQENSYQMILDLGINGFAGYTTVFQNFEKDYPVYNPRTAWVNYIYDDTYPKIYAAYFEINQLVQGNREEIPLAWATVLRAAITHNFTDIYGPIPYTSMAPNQLSVAYDSQEQVYKALAEDLMRSVTTLRTVDLSNRQYASFDLVYGGDMSKWVKFANSLLLRIAVRMGDKAPAEARQYAEFAFQNGLILTNADNAQMATLANPLQKVTSIWVNSAVNAEITEYMNAYGDPRRDRYFTAVSNRSVGRQYFGVRNGTVDVNYSMANYSKPNLNESSAIIWINAAEVAFLRAEAALNGWNVGGNAADLYASGIALSFEQWGAPLGSYLTNSSLRGALNDELTPAFNTSFSSAVSVNWADANGDVERQLAKIITQKWIANYPYAAIESWSEWRRTGYPNMIPASANNSAGTVTSITQIGGRDRGGMRRIPYSRTEYTTNAANVRQALSLLNGPDNAGTDLWWAR